MADFIGTNSSETLTGTEDDDLLQGLGGNDTLFGLGGDDILDGGTGSNTLTGGTGADTFLVSSFIGGYTNTITDFETGSDRIDLSVFNIGSFETLLPFISLDGNATRFTFEYDGQSQTFALEGIDPSDLSASDFIFNTSTDDLIVTTGTGRSFVDYTLFGGLGDDTITSGTGDDILSGGAGDDIFNGSLGDNIYRGGQGNDIFAVTDRGGQENTIEDFTQGQDRIDVSALNVARFEDLLPFLSQDGDNTILTTVFDGRAEVFIIEDLDLADLTANDFIFNTDNTNLTVTTGTGRTFVDYTLFGGNGNDDIFGRTGDDTLVGGLGNDVLDGGLGDNIIYSGEGIDTIFMSSRGAQSQTIRDFELAGDTIDVRVLNVADLATLMPYLSQDGDDVVINTLWDGQGELIRIEDTLLEDITAGNFRFNTFAADLEVTASARTFVDYTLFGGNGDDDITAFRGDDELNGGAGNDSLDGGFGTNLLRGGAGEDEFVVASERDFRTTDTTIADFVQGEDQIDVRGLNVGDLDTLTPYLRQEGDDVVLNTFYDGVNEIYRIQNIQLDDLTEDDFRFNTNNAGLTVNAVGRSTTEYALFGGNGDDVLNGSTPIFNRNSDVLNGGAGDDELNGFGGIDILRGGDGADELNGGDGFDQASYLTAITGVNINLQTGETSGDQTEGDTFDSVEGVEGSQFDDVLTGLDIGAGRFDGLDGNDVINLGVAQEDTANIANGGDGDDMIFGNSGNDFIDGVDGR